MMIRHEITRQTVARGLSHLLHTRRTHRDQLCLFTPSPAPPPHPPTPCCKKQLLDTKAVGVRREKMYKLDEHVACAVAGITGRAATTQAPQLPPDTPSRPLPVHLPPRHNVHLSTCLHHIGGPVLLDCALHTSSSRCSGWCVYWPISSHGSKGMSLFVVELLNQLVVGLLLNSSTSNSSRSDSRSDPYGP